MYDEPVRQSALGALGDGNTLGEVARQMGINRSTLRSWRDNPDRILTSACARSRLQAQSSSRACGSTGFVSSPQHGPGRKHQRAIVLEPWQSEIVESHAGDFLRGLFHSDGARVKTWATRMVAGERKRYDYPRWQFVNRSDDIIDLYTALLDRAGIAWRRSRINMISVSRADDVRRLDELIGLKA